MFSFKKVKD